MAECGASILPRQVVRAVALRQLMASLTTDDLPGSTVTVVVAGGLPDPAFSADRVTGVDRGASMMAQNPSAELNRTVLLPDIFT